MYSRFKGIGLFFIGVVVRINGRSRKSVIYGGIYVRELNGYNLFILVL